MLRALVIVSLVSLASADAVDKEECSPDGIMVYKTHDVVVQSCRKCFCGREIRSFCEEVKCVPSNGTELVTLECSCYYKGKLYKKGDCFLDYCNKCHCRGYDDVLCAKNPCHLQLLSSTPDHISGCTYRGYTYPLGKTFADGCSECFCSVHGFAGCIYRECPPYIRILRIEAEPDTCHCNGNTYNINGTFTNYLATCTCLGHNKFICKDNWWISKGPVMEDLCSPTGMMYQTSYKDLGSCRKCSCGGNVSLDCEQVKCFPSNGTERVSRKDSCYYKDKLYKKDEEFLDYCNRCVCFGTDTVHCTKRSCGQTNPSQVVGTNCSYGNRYYKSGKPFVKDCEHCFCTDYGEAHCLPRSCPPHKKILIIEDSCEYNGFFISKHQHFVDQNCQWCKCAGRDNVVCSKISCKSWLHVNSKDYDPLADACGPKRSVSKIENDAANVTTLTKWTLLTPFSD